jgi:hypothetical protein
VAIKKRLDKRRGALSDDAIAFLEGRPSLTQFKEDAYFADLWDKTPASPLGMKAIQGSVLFDTENGGTALDAVTQGPNAPSICPHLIRI